jgi:hypothetical protein
MARLGYLASCSLLCSSWRFWIERPFSTMWESVSGQGLATGPQGYSRCP